MKCKLSEHQKAMLLRLANGDYPTSTVDGLYWATEPVRVDGRTLSSLIRHRLVSVTTGTGSGMLIQGFWLTDYGEKIVKELEDEAYQKRRAQRGW